MYINKSAPSYSNITTSCTLNLHKRFLELPKIRSGVEQNIRTCF